MAVLGKIRSLGPVALISVIGLALFAFVFSTGSGTVTDVFKADEFNQSRVAIVNGIEMDRTDFMNTVDNIEKQNRGSRSSIQAMNSVWDTELKKLILQSEYEKLGLSVEREMMRDLLRNNLLAFEDFIGEEVPSYKKLIVDSETRVDNRFLNLPIFNAPHNGLGFWFCYAHLKP